MQAINIKDANNFFVEPELPPIAFSPVKEGATYQEGKFSFKSQVNTQWQNNDHATGYYFKSNNNPQNISVIMVHGWRSEGFGHFDKLFLDDFKEKGFNLFYYTLPLHLDRQPNTSLYSGEYMISANVEGTVEAIKQAVTDLRALIKWIKEKKGEKVILIGISLGGYVTNLTATLEAQIDGLISIMYANSLSFSIWKTVPGKYIKEDLVNNGFTYEELKDYWNIIDPSQYNPLITNDNILLISGLYDQYVLLEDTNRLWKQWQQPKRLLYPCGHAGIVLCRKKIRRDVMKYINKFTVSMKG